MDDVDETKLYEAARLYYEAGLGQSEVAAALGVSRPTVSRLLARAREAGIVQIRVVRPDSPGMSPQARELADALGLRGAYLAPGTQSPRFDYGMEPAVQAAITDMGLRAGDAVVVASGMATAGIANMRCSGLGYTRLVPAVGGAQEPEVWFQTNETVRRLAANSNAEYTPLFAEAIPSSPVYEALQQDDSFRNVLAQWRDARGAIVGVGSRTTGRVSISKAIPQDALPSAVGDVCLHFFDETGAALRFPNSERTVHISREHLMRIPEKLGCAVGPEKVESIIVAARAGFFNRLVTDVATADLILRRL
ncbi:sugar-binding transcriptional regulator [Corynebacterium gottingense]|uniref:Winged helix-turn-helix transcriptional regulator n=1 Tax=Corynebacterium gottingense TaxID=2041036 RepID=A0ABX9UJ77_9CORY|nr:sugar-binding domain-containing protein [Corynebacterium gottingense]RMD17941.1 winged helix-turn-helix transcriptional regulator [Corynebacterium gottingense]WJZ14232.1 Sorbitol operon regulator [Corynebacterium gottingense]WJZ16545.1 Sorbitol operon regulator [Corynebacterium gottingense]